MVEKERLRGEAAAEDFTNEREAENMKGEYVLFGSEFQLRHIASGSFMVMDNVRSVMNTHALKASLHESGSEASWTRMMPSYKAQAIGDIVRYGDLVTLFGVRQEVPRRLALLLGP